MADAAHPLIAGDRVFVGREAEMDLLTRGMEDVLAGHGRIFLVTGEPGIGKTRLVSELCAVAEARGMRTVWGRCWEGGGAPPYWPLTQILRAYGRRTEPAVLGRQLGGGADDIATLVPEWDCATDALGQAGTGSDPEQARFRLFDAVATFLRRAASQQPLLLVFDDIHWADEASLLLLRFIARDVRHSPLLLLTTYRDAEARLRPSTAALLGQLGRESETLPLSGLSESAVARYIDAIAQPAAPLTVATVVHRASEGNPLFVDEVVQLLRSQGRLDASAEAALLNSGVPDGVREIIRARLQLLELPTRTLLALAAVVGREFELRTLSAVARQNESPQVGTVADIIATAETLGVIVPVGDSLGRYRFAHGLFCETLYEDLSAAERGDLHHQVGLVLQSQYGTEAAELAHHFLRSSDSADGVLALRYSRAAAEAALASLAYEAAVSHFMAALRTLRMHTDAAERTTPEIALLINLGGAKWRAGEAAPATEFLLDAADRARVAQEPELFAQAVLALGAVRFERGRPDDLLVAFLEEALQGLADSDSVLRARLMARFAQAFYLIGGSERSRDMALQAVEMARRLADDAALAAALLAQHRVLWRPESTEERLAIAIEITRLTQASGDDEQRFDGLHWRVFDLLELGRRQAADEAIDEYERLARTLRHPLAQWYTTVYRSLQAFLAGDFGEAEQRATAGLQVRQADGTPLSQFYGAQIYSIRREQGRLAELGPAMQLYAEQNPQLTVWQCAVALFDAEVGNLAAARQRLERLAEEDFADLPYDVNWLTTMSILAEVAVAVGDRVRAARLYEMLLPFARRHVLIIAGAAYRGPVAHHLGLLAHTLHRWPEADEHFKTALEMSRDLRAVPMLVRTQFEQARMLRAAGATDGRAEELLAAAKASAVQLGMRQVEDGIDGLVATAPLPSETARPSSDLSAPSPTAEFRCEQGAWVLSLTGSAIRLADTKGLRCLHYLLSHPDSEVPALLLQDLTRDAAESPAGAEEATLEATERARVNVTRLLNNALKRIEADDAALTRYLRGCIKTGTTCSYTPSPLRPIVWRL